MIEIRIGKRWFVRSFDAPYIAQRVQLSTFSTLSVHEHITLFFFTHANRMKSAPNDDENLNEARYLFPIKLYRLLEFSDNHGHSNIISWYVGYDLKPFLMLWIGMPINVFLSSFFRMPDGLSFRVLDKVRM
jgi:hypothetical protein